LSGFLLHGQVADLNRRQMPKLDIGGCCSDSPFHITLHINGACYRGETGHWDFNEAGRIYEGLVHETPAILLQRTRKQ